MAREFTSLRQLDTPVKVLFTGYLSSVAVGYLMALIQILFTHGMADGKFGLSIDDIAYSNYGTRSATLLETQLNGAMKENASEQERFKIIQWVRDGADKEEYSESGVETIIQQRCVMCHSGQTSLPNFNDFNVLKDLSRQDDGATFSSLTRVSHIHLFGISFIFMFVGLIFSFAETSTTKYKCIAIGMPYAFLLVDILSWWLTKLDPIFAWLVIMAGTGMAVSFFFMWTVSVLEMWWFDKAFVNVNGEPHPRWSETFEAKLKQHGVDVMMLKLWDVARSNLIKLTQQVWKQVQTWLDKNKSG